MAVLSDYIKWRGDLEFWQDGFNEFDNLLFSAICYVEIDKIFERSDCKVLSLKYISEEYHAPGADVKRFPENSVLKETPVILKQAGESRRYANVLVRNYESIIDAERILQFGAMEFLLPDGTSYVAFRGTDGTIVGWKEDFMMAVEETAGEKESVAYLNRVAGDGKRPLRIGGHSKGGHLAVYAASMCESAIQERIIGVYSNDGPGFSPEFTEQTGTKAIASKVMHIVPEEDIVGMLMEPVGNTIMVKSCNKGPMQHDLLSWSIDAMRFETVSALSKGSVLFDKALKGWMVEFEQLDKEEKRVFVNDLFSVLEESGVETLTEIQDGGVKTLQMMRRQLNELSPDTKEKVVRILKELFHVVLAPAEQELHSLSVGALLHRDRDEEDK